MTLSLTTQGRSIWDVQDKDASTASGGEDTRNQGKARRMGRMFNYFFLLLSVAHRAQQEDENDGKRTSGFKVMRRYDEESRKYWNNMLSVRSSEFDFKKQVSVIDSPRYKKVLKEIRSEDSKAAQARQQDADKRKAEAAARAGKGAGKGKDARRDDVPRVPHRDPVPQRDPHRRRDDREPREPAIELFLRESAIGRRRRYRRVGIGRRRGSASSGISAGSPMMLSRGPPSAIVRLAG